MVLVIIYCVVGFALLIAGWVLTYNSMKEAFRESMNTINSESIFYKIIFYAGCAIIIAATVVTWPIWAIRGLIKS